MAEQQKKTPAFAVSVFGVTIKNNAAGEPTILVNVRTNQAEQKNASGHPTSWPGIIVHLPGGLFGLTDTSNKECLLRRVKAQTGCEAKIVGGLLGAFDRIDIHKPAHELTLGYRIELVGEPQLTAEISEHLWVTLGELESKTSLAPVRFPGGSGRNGRLFSIALRGLEEYEKAVIRQQSRHTSELAVR